MPRRALRPRGLPARWHRARSGVARAAAHAAKCEAIRNELGAAVDGEQFFQWARRAAWLASEAPKRGISSLHGARAAETIVAWLAHELSGIAFSGVLEPGHRLEEKWVARMAACATRLVDSRHDDVLGLAPPEPVRRQLGPCAGNPPRIPLLPQSDSAPRRAFQAALAMETDHAPADSPGCLEYNCGSDTNPLFPGPVLLYE